MLRFIWDKVRKILPVSLLLTVSGTLCYLLMKHAGEDTAALVGLFAIGVAILLIGLMVFYALRDLLRWRREFNVAAALDDYCDAKILHPNARAGRDRLFFNSVALEYGDIHSMYCMYESTASTRGYVNWWYTLYALRTDGKKFRVLLVQEKKNQDSRAQAAALFGSIMDIVKQKNPQAELHYPDFQ